MAYGKFSLIAHYFDHVKNVCPDVETDVGNDCALPNIPEKEILIVNTDTLAAGNHLLSDIDPADLAYRMLAVGLSGLTAMGVEPAWLMLALTLPEVGET